ncbi:hypothetical protein H6F61_04700 [Cyanobacteria bacterium FACHB-472]|nr:hypothetical protein [Cyanobacteria bacterium FACHB-472]
MALDILAFMFSQQYEKPGKAIASTCRVHPNARKYIPTLLRYIACNFPSSLRRSHYCYFRDVFVFYLTD